MTIITVARKPIMAGNVASNVIEHGTGGININACRIKGAVGDGVWGGSNQAVNKERMFQHSPDMPTYTTQQHSDGRWPANVILGHTDACRRVGTKTIKAITGGSSSGGSAFGQDAGWNKHNNQPTQIQRMGDAEGLETVVSWQCTPDCPVLDLDQQSGLSKSSGFGGRVIVKRQSGSDRDGNSTPVFGSESRPNGSAMVTYDDEGGASRFFKHVGGSQ